MQNLFNTFSCLFFLALPFVVNSQQIQLDYTPIDSFRMPKQMFSEFRSGFSKWGQTTTLEKNKAKIAFIQLATQKLEFIASLDSAGLIMYNDSITSFLRSITDQIVESNELLKDHKITVFTYRSLEPNAFNVGEGIILFSLGLLERLKTIDQIAFILAHEIGHDILKHVYEDNQRFCENFYDPQFKKTFKQTARTSIGRNTQMRNLVNGFFAHHMSYSRVNELVADSLGYVLATNAGFHSGEAFVALEVLDASDQLRYPDTLPLQVIFDFNKFKFKSYRSEERRVGKECR